MSETLDRYGLAVEAAAARALAQLPEPLPQEVVQQVAAELLDLPPAHRALRVRNGRYAGRLEVVWHLIAASDAVRHRDPQAMLDLAQAAVEVAEALEPERSSRELVADVRAEAWAVLANAQRVASDLPAAVASWRVADARLAAGTGDPQLAAKFAALRGTLCSEQGRPGPAVRLLRRAVRLYRALGDRHQAGLELLALSKVHWQAAESREAIEALVAAIREIDPGRDPTLVQLSFHNLALYLDELGFPHEALSILRLAAPAYHDREGDVTALRMRWLEGRLAAGLGGLAEAAQILDRVRRGFIELELHYDAALAGMDLAAVYARCGAMGQVEALVEEMLPVFAAQDVPGEARKALRLFATAVWRGKLGAEAVAEAAQRLWRERQRPS